MKPNVFRSGQFSETCAKMFTLSEPDGNWFRAGDNSLPHLRTRAHGIIYGQTRRFSQWIMNMCDKQTLFVIVSNEWITVHHRAITFECENFRSLDLLESVSTWERTEDLIGIFGQMFAFLPFEANHLLVINDDISDVRSWSFCEIQSAYVCCLLSKWWHKVVFRRTVALNIRPSDLYSVQKQWRIRDFLLQSNNTDLCTSLSSLDVFGDTMVLTFSHSRKRVSKCSICFNCTRVLRFPLVLLFYVQR